MNSMWKHRPSQSLTERLLTAQVSHAAEYERGDNLIRGVMSLLPKPGSIWPLDDRAKWLRAAAGIFDVSYNPGDGEHKEISIVLSTRSKWLPKESEVTVPLTERQLGRLERIRARMNGGAERESRLPGAAA